MAKTDVTMKVNGAEVEGLVEPRTLLVHFLRENLSLTGTHIGCETTHCGACTVALGGRNPGGHIGQYLPLHRLPEHRQGNPVRRRQDQRRGIQGGRGMNDLTPTREQRTAALEGMGCKRKRVEDARFTQGKGNYVDDVKL